MKQIIFIMSLIVLAIFGLQMHSYSAAPETAIQGFPIWFTALVATFGWLGATLLGTFAGIYIANKFL